MHALHTRRSSSTHPSDQQQAMRILPASTSSAKGKLTVVKVAAVSRATTVPDLAVHTASPIDYIDEVITLRPFARAVLWGTIFFVVLANAALLAIFAYEYAQNETNDSLLWLFRMYFLFSNGNAFLMHHSRRVALGYAVLCAVFVAVALKLVWTSVVSGRLRFGSPSVNVNRTLNSKRVRAVLAPPMSMWHHIKYGYSKWHRAFGVRGPYFDYRLLAEEVFEIGGQTIAAYSSSRSISNVPLNIVFAVVIFFNSIAAFVFRRVFKYSLLKQRLACLMIDLALDFIWGTLLPMWMYVPIVKVYLDRANVIMYLTSFSNSTRAIERVLILSWKNYALSVVPFCNSLINLLELQGILREMSQVPTPVAPDPSLSQGTSFLQLRYPIGRHKHGRFVRLAHTLLPLYGTGVLLMALAANGAFKPVLEQQQMPCMHRVFPWFSTKEACLGRQLNCTTLGIDGNRLELEHILTNFDRSSLADLFLLSCPGLEMPSTIQHFDQLMTIVIKDSTMVAWDETAFLDKEIFHELRTIQLFSVEFVDDPIGFTGRDTIAESVEWIHLENVDGTRLLSLVGNHWRGVQYFDCMFCGLTNVPEALYHMPRLTMVSLANNAFASIPDNWIPQSNVHLQMIWLDDNSQLVELPDSLWQQSATCGVFSVSHSNLSIVPEWVADIAGPDFMLTAAGTPVCAENAQLSPRVAKLVTCVGF